MKPYKSALIILSFSCLVACSANQVQLSTPLTLVATTDSTFVLRDGITIKAKNSAPSILKAGTLWSQIGSIEQGDVFSTRDQVVIVNSFDVHEASIVVSNEMVVGYYLTVEKTFVEAKPVEIKLMEEGDWYEN